MTTLLSGKNNICGRPRYQKYIFNYYCQKEIWKYDKQNDDQHKLFNNFKLIQIFGLVNGLINCEKKLQ